MKALRSLLFVPATSDRKIDKAFASAADAVIVDLEDAVAVSEKPAARAALETIVSVSRALPCWVRINAMTTRFCHRDVIAATMPGVAGIILPKVESAASLLAADWLIEQLERERGLKRRSIDLLPIIETARGLTDIDAILRAGSRVRRVAFGAGDFTLDTNITWSRGEAELLPARSAIVASSRAAGLEAPMDSVWVDLQDPEGLEASARHVKGLGFQGKMCIHPGQVPIVNGVFTPTDAEVHFAERVVAAFETAEAAGLAAIQLDGKFIDYPIVYRAQRVLKSRDAIIGRTAPAR